MRSNAHKFSCHHQLVLEALEGVGVRITETQATHRPPRQLLQPQEHKTRTMWFRPATGAPHKATRAANMLPRPPPPATTTSMFLFTCALLIVIPTIIFPPRSPSSLSFANALPQQDSNKPPQPAPPINDNNSSPPNSPNKTSPSVNVTATTELLMNLVKNGFHSKSSSNNNNNKSPSSLHKPLLPSLDHYRQQDSQTAYVCEGNQLELTCPEGKLLRVLRAVYGRFSVSICNEIGHSNLSVQCHSFGAFIIIQRTCNKRGNCSVPVSPELFGDPCEGTSKYLEVQYSCEAGGEEYPRFSHAHHRHNPQPPAVIVAAGDQQQPQPPSQSAHIVAMPDPRLPATPSYSGGHNSRSQVDDKQVGGQLSNVIHNNNQHHQAAPFLPASVLQPSRAGSDQLGQEALCGPRTSVRNLSWNYTRPGERARQPCPEGSLGYASWLCDAERAQFVPIWSPDFGQCKSKWLQSLSQQLDQTLEAASKQQQSSADQMRSTADKLVREILNEMSLMAHTRQLFSEDLKQIDLMIRQIIEQLKSYSGALSVYLIGWQARPNYSEQLPLEELLTKVASLVSSVFDVSQRNAWLEIQSNEMRRRLEQRYLNHLKEAGLMVASSGRPPVPSASSAVRHGNVFAGITVISKHLKPSPSSPGSDDFELNQLLRQSQMSLNRFVTESNEQMEINELKIPLNVLRELASNGMNRFLVLDVKKPDYALMKQQLESAYENLASSAALDQFSVPDAQWSSRAFGVFVLDDAGDVLDGEQSSNTQQAQRVAEVLSQWPISVDFRITTPLVASNGQPLLRQCTSMLGDTFPNRCQTVRSNLTSHLCRCEQFGFMALATSANQLVPIDSLSNSNNYHWPSMGAPTQIVADPPYEDLLSRSSLGADRYIGAPSNKQTPQEPPLGIWFTVFITFGLSLFVLTVVGFLMNVVVRTLNQRNLRKNHSALSGAMFGSVGSGPTTGPMTHHHTLLNNTDQPLGMVTSAVGTTTQSSSVLGLTQSACSAGCKSQQQLYASHYPPMELCGHLAPSNSWTDWVRWLRPSHWFTARNNKSEVQQHVIGSSILGNGSVAYKSHIQNGYTTSMHRAPTLPNHLTSLPLAMPSSSNSSYVSSSAYYEEIGPGNLTKVNTGARTTHTIVEPFKQTTASSGPVDQQVWTYTTSLDQKMNMNAVEKHLNTDLNQHQSSSSSATSQHSASTNVTNASASTPRHYLFTSPTAANAYKNSMGNQILHHQQHHQACHQSQQMHRFMPNHMN